MLFLSHVCLMFYAINRTSNLIGFQIVRSQWGGYSQSEHKIKVRAVCV